MLRPFKAANHATYPATRMRTNQMAQIRSRNQGKAPNISRKELQTLVKGLALDLNRPGFFRKDQIALRKIVKAGYSLLERNFRANKSFKFSASRKSRSREEAQTIAESDPRSLGSLGG
jgi:hypothetical protein